MSQEKNVEVLDAKLLFLEAEFEFEDLVEEL